MTGNGASQPAHRVDGSLAVVAALVLLVCTYYVLAYGLYAPYPGLDYDNQWVVLRFDDACNSHPDWCAANGGHITVGDRLLTIGNLSFDQYQRDRNSVPFDDCEAGDTVDINLVRDGQAVSTTWTCLGPTLTPRLIRLSGSLFFLPFWLAGTAVLLLLRPRDSRWLVLVLFNYLTGLWIAVGNFSSSQMAGASQVLHLLTWMMMPIYLHLHLLVPTPVRLGKGRWVLIGLYIFAAVMALRESLGNPTGLALVAALDGVLGSLAILIYRSIARTPTSSRLATRLMLVGVGLSFGPGILLWVIPRLLDSRTPGWILTGVMTVAIPLLPFFYVYTLYKRRLGNLEFRANRALSLYGFILIFGTGFIVVFLVGDSLLKITAQGYEASRAILPFALAVSTAALTLALWLRAPFQRFIDRLAYGTEHNPDTIIRTFANQIPRALDRGALSRLLIQDVSPALLIRQSALYLLSGTEAAPEYADGVSIYSEPDLPGLLHHLLGRARRYLPPDLEPYAGPPFDWVRLTIPIEVGGKRIAVWLLGKRDPDDYYPVPDIELLTTLGNQIGVALETARLFENLQRRASELETAYRDLQRLDRLKDEFVQNVSHELRTPLTFLRGYIDLLSEQLLGPITEQQREALNTMSDRTEGIIRLVNDIISQQHASVDQLVREPVNLAVLASSCIEAMEVSNRKRAAGQPAHTFRLVVADNVPQIGGDRRRLAQVIDNLLGNAVKFSPDGGEVTVDIHPSTLALEGNGAAAQAAVIIDVRDQGIGIPANEIEYIWRRFYQIDGSSTRRFGGMGLGLAIVRGIVEAHCGKIWVDSQVGVGSVFHVALPLVPAPSDPVAGPASQPASPLLEKP